MRQSTFVLPLVPCDPSSPRMPSALCDICSHGSNPTPPILLFFRRKYPSSCPRRWLLQSSVLLALAALPGLERGLAQAAPPWRGRAPTPITAGATPLPSFARATPTTLSLLNAGGAVLSLTRGWDVDAAAVRGQARHGLCSGRRRRVHG